MNLYDGRSKIIKLFEDKKIKPNNFTYNAKHKSEPEYESEYETKYEPDYEPEYEPKFKEAIAKRAKKRKQIIHQIAEEEKRVNIQLLEKYLNYQNRSSE